MVLPPRIIQLQNNVKPPIMYKYLVPNTSTSKWLFQLDDSKSFHEKMGVSPSVCLVIQGSIKDGGRQSCEGQVWRTQDWSEPKWTMKTMTNPPQVLALCTPVFFCWVWGPYVIVIYCNYLFFFGGRGGYRRLRVRKISFKMAPVFVKRFVDGTFWEMWEVDGRVYNFSVSKFNNNSRNVSPTR